MENKKYYIVRDINFARVIKWFCGQDYMVFDDKCNDGRKIYSFENTDKLKQALTLANDAKRKMDY